MRKLLPLLLISMCCSASAGWEHWVSSEVNNDFYVDPQSIEKSNAYRRFWVLENYPTADNRVLSTISLFEIDCSKKRKRVLDQHWYTEQFGGGSSITPNLKFPGAWRFSVPGTSLAEIVRIGCKK